MISGWNGILSVTVKMQISSFAISTYHAKCVKTESTEHATTSELIWRNSSILLLKAMISVGQTKVLK